VTAYLEQYFAEEDLSKFFGHFFPNFPHDSLVRSMEDDTAENDPENPGPETAVDVQYIMAIGLGVKTELFYTAGRAPDNAENEPFLEWLFNMNAKSDEEIPYVVSTSYGDDEATVSHAYAKRVNVELQKLTLRGVTLVYSSGDNGARGYSQDESCDRFMAHFPSTSPWVTAVGSTQIVPSFSDGVDGELAAEFSGGGFSDLFKMPHYQQLAVQAYLGDVEVSAGLNQTRRLGASRRPASRRLASSVPIPPAHLFNRSGRAYPDVSVVGFNYPYYQHGQYLCCQLGTSSSAPVFAGMVSLLNDARFEKGLGSLGFLNPLIYFAWEHYPKCFTDVTQGTQHEGCSGREGRPAEGFAAAEGWDPLTGVGAPDFQQLKKLVLRLGDHDR
jgi:tripeptidyl-peptidase-1